jgi:hypothetical protein
MELSQTTPGPVDFIATAVSVTVVNPLSDFYMTGGSSDHFCNLCYSESGTVFSIYGILVNVSKRPNSQSGPFAFNQGKMTGTFQHG